MDSQENDYIEKKPSIKLNAGLNKNMVYMKNLFECTLILWQIPPPNEILKSFCWWVNLLLPKHPVNVEVIIKNFIAKLKMEDFWAFFKKLLKKKIPKMKSNKKI